MEPNGRRLLRLGLSMGGHGYHYNAWLHPRAEVQGPSTFDYYRNLAAVAERGLFDMVFLADLLYFRMVDIPKGALGRRGDSVGLEPIGLLTAIATHTKHVGLVATKSTTFSDPYSVARSFASLDRISDGRAGWNVVTSSSHNEAKNFGYDAIPDSRTRYARANEFVDVVSGLWNSFTDKTFSPDRDTGRYFDPTEVQQLNHAGTHFRVRGPLNIQRSAQQRPILVQAGASPEGQELAARTADVVYALQPSLTSAQQFYSSIKGRLGQYNRRPESMHVMPGLLPVVGRTKQEAQEKYRALQEMVDPLIGLEYLSNFFGDLSHYPVDGPLPELRNDVQLTSRGEALLRLARTEGLSIKQLYQRVSVSNAHYTAVGTPEMIVDVMEAWFNGGAADGFNILPAVSPGDVEDFVEFVVPELQRRDLFRRQYESDTLRGNLGL